MYSDILAFLHSVLKLNTVFCFNLLQAQEALDRIVLLFSLDATFTGRVQSFGQELSCKDFLELSQKRFSYTLFQNGRHFSILLFTCKLALDASFKGKYSFEFRV